MSESSAKKIKIISWNVNGIRAIHKKGKWAEILAEEPDILCLQETKANPDQLGEDILHPPGYESFFDFPKVKKGYSGVAIYVKTGKNGGAKIAANAAAKKLTPQKVEYLMGVPTLDDEGRLVAVYFEDFVLINVYFPNSGGGPERLKYKLDFYKEFLKFIQKTRKTQPNIVFCGDINTAHNEIDLARPKENSENTGFLPIERAWLDEVVGAGYVDTFRHFFPTTANAYTYWDMKTFARERNVGWRIDYFFVSKEFLPHIKSTKIHEDFFGSDHCPISIEVDLGA